MGGIVIGVLALTTMGGLAERINSLVDGGVRFYSDHVSVVSAGGLIRTDKAAEIERVAGVDAALPFIFLITPRLVAVALGFAVGLGCVAGMVPALRAARLDPVLALRSQ